MKEKNLVELIERVVPVRPGGCRSQDVKLVSLDGGNVWSWSFDYEAPDGSVVNCFGRGRRMTEYSALREAAREVWSVQHGRR